MDRTFAGNDTAYEQLKNYSLMEHPGPLILHGPKGTGKKLAAMSLCRELLGCEKDSLTSQPDFCLLDKKGDSIKVEDVLAIIQKSGITSFRKRKVFLILGADLMNEQAQNKMLKLLEDRNQTNTVVLVCEENRLLPTIQSRCITIGFHPLSKSEMDSFLKRQGIKTEDSDLFGFLCGNCPYRVDDVRGCFTTLKDTFLKIMAIRDRRELLHILHLVKEKDSEDFYAVHGSCFDYALCMLLYVFINILYEKTRPMADSNHSAFRNIANLYSPREAFEISNAICSHRGNYKRGSYSKNDFFDLARIII